MRVASVVRPTALLLACSFAIVGPLPSVFVSDCDICDPVFDESLSKAVCLFLDNNNLLSVIRAHEAQDAGYKMYKVTFSLSLSLCVCVFVCVFYVSQMCRQVQTSRQRLQCLRLRFRPTQRLDFRV